MTSHSKGEFSTETETTVPFYEYIKRQELSSREFYSLEELLHKAKVLLKTLKPREIALKRRDKKTLILKVPFTPDIPEIPHFLQEARQKIFTNSKVYATIKEIAQEEKQRLKSLQKSREVTLE